MNASVGRRVGDGGRKGWAHGYDALRGPGDRDAPVVVPGKATLNSVSNTSQPVVQTQFRDG